MKPETIAGLLSGARSALSEAGIETASLDARLLLQAATGLGPEDFIAMPDHAISPLMAAAFQELIARRLGHEPVSRILGVREFYGRPFKVTPAVLDPRPDTEAVVDLALRLVREGRFIDIGTGSGAIAVTLCGENPNLEGLATDLSSDALAIASQNAEVHGVAGQLRFQQGAWFAGVAGKFDLIISNPPYIRSAESLPPEVLNFDPHLALFGGEDGLSAYRPIAQGAKSHLMPGGTVVLEIGHDQAEAVIAIFKACDFMLIDRIRDIASRDRGLAFRAFKPDEK